PLARRRSMPCDRPPRLPRIHSVVGVVLLLCAGCGTIEKRNYPADLPRELKPASLPPYVIEPPDVLLIDALRLIPKPPYKIAPMDVLGIQVTETLPMEPISGLYNVDPDGRISLGYSYTSVRVEGLTLEQAKAAIVKALVDAKKLKMGAFEVTVVLAESRAMQQIRGPHLVRP